MLVLNQIPYEVFLLETRIADNWQKFLQNQDKEGKRKGLVALYSMLLKHDMRIATAALTYALDKWSTRCRQYRI